MAYLQGTSTGVIDMLGQLCDFAVTQGFTRGPVFTVGTSTLFTLHKNGIYFVMRYQTGANWFDMNTATGLDQAQGAPDKQPGALSSSNARVGYGLTGPYVAHHFFCTEEAIHCMVEVATNVFFPFSLGFINKTGSWVGGAYVTGCVWNASYTWAEYRNMRIFDPWDNYGAGRNYRGHVRVDYLDLQFAVFASEYGYGHQVTSGANACLCSWTYEKTFVPRCPNYFNTRSVIVPPLLSVPNNGWSGSTAHSHLGYVPGIGLLDITQLNPKDVVDGGWMVFPWCQKNGPGNPYVNTGDWGLAFKL